jgi:hypothetical protein
MLDANTKPRQAGPMAPSSAALVDHAVLAGADPGTLPFRIRYQPVRRAIWAALMLDCATLRAFVARATEPGGKRANDSPADDSLPERLAALDVIAARLVLNAVDGDVRAFEMIANRIEGRVGMRPGEVAPEDEARREDMQAVIESIITTLTNAKLASADDSLEDSASDRTPVVIDAEARR